MQCRCALAIALRAPDVQVADLVADAPRAGVKRCPDRVRLVRGELDEVIASAERAELQLPVRIDGAVVARARATSSSFDARARRCR